jgi:hypothetical protein
VTAQLSDFKVRYGLVMLSGGRLEGFVLDFEYLLSSDFSMLFNSTAALLTSAPFPSISPPKGNAWTGDS